MKNYLKYFVIVLILVLCLLVLTGCSIEDNDKIQIPEVLEDTYIYDQGNFIDDNIEKDTNKFLDELEEKTQIEFVVITIDSLNDLTIEQYANKLANTLGIGKEKEDNGILLLISKNDNKVRLEIGNGMQGIITDSISGRILDQYFVPLREEDNYNQAVYDTVQATINVIKSSEEYDFEIENLDDDKIVQEITETEIIVFIIIIIVLIILEFGTGYIWGDGFGDGIVFLVLSSMGSSSSSGGSRFGGGHFGGRRSFKIKNYYLGGILYEKIYRYCNWYYFINCFSCGK